MLHELEISKSTLVFMDATDSSPITSKTSEMPKISFSFYSGITCSICKINPYRKMTRMFNSYLPIRVRVQINSVKLKTHSLFVSFISEKTEAVKNKIQPDIFYIYK